MHAAKQPSVRSSRAIIELRIGKFAYFHTFCVESVINVLGPYYYPQFLNDSHETDLS